MKNFLIIFFFSLTILPETRAQDSLITLAFDGVDEPPKSFIPHKLLKRPRVGLALSGGGARCIAQIGVLEVLEENHILIDFIVGTSMGSIIGGLYAAGYSPQEIWNIARRIRWDQIMVDTPPRTSLFLGQKQERDRYILQFRLSSFKPYIPPAFTPGQKLTHILTDLTMRADYPVSPDFDQLRIPFRAVATDLVSGRKVVIKKGDLAQAMRASIAIPLLFTPVEHRGMLLVDGGLVDNIPVDEVKKEGVDLVIGVDATSKLRSKEQINAPWEVADQVTSIMQRERNRSQRAQADVFIQIDAGERSAVDFANLEQLRQEGREKTLEKIDEIKNLIRQKEKIEDNGNCYRITSVKIEGGSQLGKELLHQWIGHSRESYLSSKEILEQLEKIYSSGYFSNVQARLCQTSLTYILDENPVLEKIKVMGNTIFPDSVILAQISSPIGKAINYPQGKRDLRAIIKLYRGEGFSLANIERVEFEEDKGILTITIDEGRIANIRLEGNQRTRDHVVLREFPLKKGDIFNIKKANQGITNIHSTGFFNTVFLSVITESAGPVVVVKLLEKKFDLLRIGGRYDLERNGRGFIELADANLLGTGNKVTLHTQYGDRDLQFKAQFRADRIFKTYLTYNLNLYHKKGKYFTYSEGRGVGEYREARTGLSFSIGQQMRRFGTLSLEGKLEQIDLQPISGRGYPRGTMNLKTLAARSVVDTQDRIPFPRNGKYHLFSYEISSGKFLTSQVSYFKVYSSLEAYSTLWKYHTFHYRLSWGSCDLTTPFPQQFRLGGKKSFYGLREVELVGRHLLLGSLEYRLQLPWRTLFTTYLNLRYDIGAVWKNTLDIETEDFIHGLGLEIAWDTFLGPVYFAYGRVSTGRERLYFSAGYRF